LRPKFDNHPHKIPTLLLTTTTTTTVSFAFHFLSFIAATNSLL